MGPRFDKAKQVIEVTVFLTSRQPSKRCFLNRASPFKLTGLGTFDSIISQLYEFAVLYRCCLHPSNLMLFLESKLTLAPQVALRQGFRTISTR